MTDVNIQSDSLRDEDRLICAHVPFGGKHVEQLTFVRKPSRSRPLVSHLTSTYHLYSRRFSCVVLVVSLSLFRRPQCPAICVNTKCISSGWTLRRRRFATTVKASLSKSTFAACMSSLIFFNSSLVTALRLLGGCDILLDGLLYSR